MQQFASLSARQLMRAHPGTTALWLSALALLVVSTIVASNDQMSHALARWAMFLALFAVMRSTFVIAKAAVCRLTQITAALTVDVPLDAAAPPLVDVSKPGRRARRSVINGTTLPDDDMERTH